jgi:hypothetical protein
VLRRSLVLLLAAGPLAACGPRGIEAAAAATPRAAVAGDYEWFVQDRDLANGFCFTWVRGLSTRQVLTRLHAKDLERVYWEQLVGSGDGQRAPADRYFFGVARIDNWVLIVEDRGDLGTTDRLMIPLSRGTTLVSHYNAGDGHGRFLLLGDGRVELDFDPLTEAGPRTGSRIVELAPVIAAAGLGVTAGPAQHVAAALALTERITGISMTLELLREKTYLLTTLTRS